LRQRWTGSDEPLAVPLDLRREPVGPRHRTDEAEHRRSLHRPLLPGLAVDDFDGIELAVAVHSLYCRVAEQFDVGCLLNPLGEVAGHMLVEVIAANDKRSEEHTSELQSRGHIVCRLLLEKKKDFLLTERHSCMALLIQYR